MISIWEKESFFNHQNIIIIGSGFVGLWSALFLKKRWPQKKITILERGLIPSGASSRNAGFACFGSLSELIHDGAEMGTEKMLRLVEMRYNGLQKIEKYFHNKVIGFERCGGYELYEQGKIDSAELQLNIQYLNSLVKEITGSKNTYRMADDTLRQFNFQHTQHLVLNKKEGYLHPGKLLQALLQTVQGEGVQVLTGVEVTNLEQGENGIQLNTRQPFSFTADQVLLCTNAFTKSLIPDIDIRPARGQVILTSPINGLPFRGTFHSDEGYYYFRNLGERVLLGGARNIDFAQEETTQMETTERIQHALENYLAQVILPEYTNRYTIEHRWSGIMAMGSEKMPIVKQLQENIYCAVRMSGMGVALAPVVGQQVSKMMH